MTRFKLSSSWLDGAALRALFAVLNAEGEARVVGGAVRNTILDRPLGDIDLATTLTPDRVAALARRAGFAVHETGLSHGTLTLVTKGQPFEVTTLREDVSTDGRRATVRFTTDWSVDAARRDFTMNALYVDAGGNGVDFFDGYRDCREGRVRFIGDPLRRIAEDRLRILRFFRFHAGYGKGPIDAEGLAAAVASRDLVAYLPAERVLHEVERLLAADGAAPMVELIAEHDILGHFFGQPLDAARFAALHDAETAAGRPVEPALGFLALVGFDGDAFERVADRLKFSRKMRKRSIAALNAAADLPPRSAPHTRALLYRHGSEAFVDGLMVVRAMGADVADLPMLMEEARRWTRPRLPVGGNDLLRQGGRPGAALGERLARLESLWCDSDFTLSREALLQIDREHIGPAGDG